MYKSQQNQTQSINNLKNELNVNSSIFNMEITRFLFFWDVTLHHWVPDVLRQYSGLIFKD